MDENVFKSSLAAISSGDYNENDRAVVNEWLGDLIGNEAKVKKLLDKNKRDFLKKRDRLSSELSRIKTEIREIRNILSNNRKKERKT